MPYSFDDNKAFCVARIMPAENCPISRILRETGIDSKQSNKLTNMEIITHCCVAKLLTVRLSPLKN